MSTPETETADPENAYEQLLDRSRKLSNLQYATMYLNWDQQVMMPEGGAPGRAQQLSTLSSVSHDLLVDEEVKEWLDALEDADLSQDEAANVREIRRQYERKANVPSELTEKLTQAAAENQQIWQQAKAEDDFETFAPRLETMRDLQREMTEYIDPDENPYAVLYEEGHPYISLDKMEEIFETLRSEIPPLVDEIRENGTELADPWEGEYPEDDQRELCEAALDFVGYDWDRGRMDTAPHPFMAGNQFDARVTTRFKDEDPMDALTATIHEFGHASYQLGLRQDEYGTPLGSPRMSIHESQSRFWENHIGRTKPFWEEFLPTFKAHIDGHDDVTAQEMYEAANRIYPNNLIRVEADELTYHMHIILRCEIDRAFVEGEITVDEIPQLWNEKMEEYLGVTPETDAEGCLQDIHWTSGFAGFQSYTIGSVVAAQLNDAIRDDLDVDELVREQNLDPIHEWMTENVHQQGQRYTTPELIEHATGQELSAEPFVDYVRGKFEDLYDL
jgi:carboxypeptidase Taq